MSRRVFTPAAAMEAKRLYGLEDEKGNRLHSQMEIAAMLGVSETTVFRAVHKRGAYMGLPAVKTEEDSAASLERLQAAIAREKLEVALPQEILKGLEEAPFTDRDLAKRKGYL